MLNNNITDIFKVENENLKEFIKKVDSDTIITLESIFYNDKKVNDLVTDCIQKINEYTYFDDKNDVDDIIHYLNLKLSKEVVPTIALNQNNLSNIIDDLKMNIFLVNCNSDNLLRDDIND